MGWLVCWPARSVQLWTYLQEQAGERVGVSRVGQMAFAHRSGQEGGCCIHVPQGLMDGYLCSLQTDAWHPLLHLLGPPLQVLALEQLQRGQRPAAEGVMVMEQHMGWECCKRGELCRPNRAQAPSPLQ